MRLLPNVHCCGITEESKSPKFLANLDALSPSVLHCCPLTPAPCSLLSQTHFLQAVWIFKKSCVTTLLAPPSHQASLWGLSTLRFHGGILSVKPVFPPNGRRPDLLSNLCVKTPFLPPTKSHDYKPEEVVRSLKPACW